MPKKTKHNPNYSAILLAACLLLGVVVAWYFFFYRGGIRSNIAHVPAFDRTDFATNTDNGEETSAQETEYPEIKANENTKPQQLNSTDVVLKDTENQPNDESANQENADNESVPKDAIPASMNLNVPFIAQAPEGNWSQPWQDACEEATILMLDAYYNDYIPSIPLIKKEIVKMVAYQDQIGWEYSIEIEKIGKVYEWYGREAGKPVRFHVITNPTVLQIKSFIANGHPVLAVARGKDLPNPYYTGDGPEYHTLIIRGYTKDSFITNDPGTRRGENFVYTYDDVMNALHDWNDGDVVHGTPAILVVKY